MIRKYGRKRWRYENLFEILAGLNATDRCDSFNTKQNYHYKIYMRDIGQAKFDSLQSIPYYRHALQNGRQCKTVQNPASQ